MEDRLLDTPYLGTEWTVRPGTIGKMLEDDWYFLNCATDLTPKPFCCVYAEGEKGKRVLKTLEKVFDEDCKGCTHTITEIFGQATSMISLWEDYTHLKRDLKQKGVIDLLNQVSVDMDVIRTSIEGDRFKEYIRKQIPKRTAFERQENKSCHVRKTFQITGGVLEVKTERIRAGGELEMSIRSRISVKQGRIQKGLAF